MIRKICLLLGVSCFTWYVHAQETLDIAIDAFLSHKDVSAFVQQDENYSEAVLEQKPLHSYNYARIYRFNIARSANKELKRLIAAFRQEKKMALPSIDFVEKKDDDGMEWFFNYGKNQAKKVVVGDDYDHTIYIGYQHRDYENRKCVRSLEWENDNGRVEGRVICICYETNATKVTTQPITAKVAEEVETTTNSLSATARIDSLCDLISKNEQRLAMFPLEIKEYSRQLKKYSSKYSDNILEYNRLNENIQETLYKIRTLMTEQQGLLNSLEHLVRTELQEQTIENVSKEEPNTQTDNVGTQEESIDPIDSSENVVPQNAIEFLERFAQLQAAFTAEQKEAVKGTNKIHRMRLNNLASRLLFICNAVPGDMQKRQIDLCISQLDFLHRKETDTFIRGLLKEGMQMLKDAKSK